MLTLVLGGLALVSLLPVWYAVRKRREADCWWSLPAWLAATVAWKTALAQDLLPATVAVEPGTWLWTGVNAFTIGILAMMLPARLFAPALWGCALGTSVIFLGDVLYYRYFEDLLSFYLWSASGQTGAVLDSAWALTQRWDLWLFADLPIAALLVGRWDSSGFPCWRLRARTALLSLLSCVVFNVIAVHNLSFTDNFRLVKRFKNITVARILGLFNYHIYDVYGQIDRYRSIVPRDPEPALALAQGCRSTIQSATPYRGIFKGRNLLMIQMESWQSFLVDLAIEGQEVTPHFNRLWRKGISARLYDQSGLGRSSDGEFAMLNSLHPPGNRPLCYAFPDDDYHGLPAILKERGYRTLYALPYEPSFWNARFMSARYGFEEQLFQDDLEPPGPDEELGWGMKDSALYERIVRRLAEGRRPFFAYLVTLNGHHPYDELEESQEELQMPERLRGTMLEDYLQINHVRDEMLGQLLRQLEQRGLSDNTVLVLVGDHDANIDKEELALLGIPGLEGNFADTVPAVIYAPGAPKFQSPGRHGQIDMAPTLLHLMGVLDAPAVFLGRNFLVERDRPVVSRGGYAVGADLFLDCPSGQLEDAEALDVRSLRSVPADRGCQPLLEAMEEEFRASDAVLQWNLVPELKIRLGDPITPRAGGGSTPTPRT